MTKKLESIDSFLKRMAKNRAFDVTDEFLIKKGFAKKEIKSAVSKKILIPQVVEGFFIIHLS